MPYGDPSPTHYCKNAFDVGENGMGMRANAADAAAATAWARSATSTPSCRDAAGEPVTIPNAICMHEEDYGMLWQPHRRRRDGSARCGARAGW